MYICTTKAKDHDLFDLEELLYIIKHVFIMNSFNDYEIYEY